MSTPFTVIRTRLAQALRLLAQRLDAQPVFVVKSSEGSWTISYDGIQMATVHLGATAPVDRTHR